MPEINRQKARLQRHRRVRKHVVGSRERPRLCVFRSSSHIYAQVIDDSCGRTLVSASTIDRAVVEKVRGVARIEQARIVGEVLAARALGVGVTRVVFDRGGYKYHGRVKALADGARKSGLEF